ncbi:MAG: 30S ribosomal protein S20 [Oscillospiraceae bacterium]|jgi:small subunit ribosomal protein S20|nr:30S ribosomal protein S20 [Oscillospiraceae bacterium]
MPNIKSAKKRAKTIVKKAARNKAYNSFLKSSIRAADLGLKTGSSDAVSNVAFAISVIDRLVSKGVLHKNNAARKKSKLVRVLANEKL